MTSRTLLLFACATLGLSQAACSSLSRSDEIAIVAEPLRAALPKPAAAQPAAPAPAAQQAPAGTG
ncbi:MAG: hypothetical protein IPK82_00695 [Polyangiaceae bacterium]|nr:hypothetical protein [Polyangiaceae bacterium]